MVKFTEERLLRIQEKIDAHKFEWQTFVDTLEDPGQLAHQLLRLHPVKRSTLFGRWLRVSELDSACIRCLVIGFYHKLQRLEYIPFWRQSMFAYGTAIHRYVQNNPSYIFDPEKFYGFWRCQACGNVIWGTKPKRYCGCGAKAFRYLEWFFASDKYCVTGHVDGILKVGNKYRLLDIKSGADECLVPQGYWRTQMVGYLEFSRSANVKHALPVPIDHEHGYIIYLPKKAQPKTPVSMFSIKAKGVVLKEVKAKAMSFKDGIEEGLLPPVLPSCVQKRFKVECVSVKQCREYYKNNSQQIKKN